MTLVYTNVLKVMRIGHAAADNAGHVPEWSRCRRVNANTFSVTGEADEESLSDRERCR